MRGSELDPEKKEANSRSIRSRRLLRAQVRSIIGVETHSTVSERVASFHVDALAGGRVFDEGSLAVVLPGRSTSRRTAGDHILYILMRRPCPDGAVGARSDQDNPSLIC